MTDRPAAGGRYIRDPETRKLTKVTGEAPAEETPPPAPATTARKGK
ncbi:hypothetical protein FHR76_002127 [Rhizobium sp. RAS22]|nr:hypothetical protein [Rhizobium sp. RAS22]